MDEPDHLVPDLGWVVVAHSRDYFETGAGDAIGGEAPRVDWDEPVSVAVHDQRRHVERTQRVLART